MFNRSSHTDQQVNNHYQTVTVTPAQGNAALSAATGLGVLVLVACTAIAVVMVIWQVALKTIDAIVMIASSIVTGLVASLPWLVGGGVVIGLFYMFLQSLPRAIAEAQVIRAQIELKRQPLMLEAKPQQIAWIVAEENTKVEAE